jgi:hypothetical protein
LALAAGIALLPLVIAGARAQETAPTETVLYTFNGGEFLPMLSGNR